MNLRTMSWDYQPLPGFRIIEDPNLTEIQEREIIIRRKGRSLALHHKIQERIPSRSIYMIGDTIVIHPARMRELQQLIEQAMNSKIERLIRQAPYFQTGA